MFKITLTLLLLVGSTAVFSQKDCSNDHTGLIPITDLGTGNYRGQIGGLYPGGSNERPPEHLANCLNHVDAIKPLDVDGNLDTENGRVVMMAIGASNPHDEFTFLKYLMEDYEPVNDYLILINGCMPNVGIQDLNTGSAVYWNYIESTLLDEGLTADQVQVIWMEEENTYMPDTTFPGAPTALVDDYHALLLLVKEKFHNAQICYISARVYSGFIEDGGGAISNGLLFPRDYYNGWGVKWLIEKQINGDINYGFEGPDATVPLITWGSYHWSDGSVPREDGFYLDCEVDLEDDGLHLNEAGTGKIGNDMFNYFAHDTTAYGWFYDEGFVVGLQNEAVENDLTVFPNPLTENILHIQSNTLHANEPISILLYAMDGSIKFKSVRISQVDMEISLPELADGVYFLTLQSTERSMTQKIVLTH